VRELGDREGWRLGRDLESEEEESPPLSQDIGHAEGGDEAPKEQTVRETRESHRIRGRADLKERLR
jgi:hypothetical protein